MAFFHLSRRIALLCVVILAISLLSASASAGDRHPAFQHCLQKCKADKCSPLAPPLAPILRLFAWSCSSDCSYHCSHAFTTELSEQEGYQQFYGKWAFWRLGGIQEPASVIFSIGNAWIHWKGFNKVKKRVSDKCGVKYWMMGLAVVQMNTWFWSAMFHTRDVPFTEKMDYFSATITIMYTLHYTLVRLFHLFAQPPYRPRNPNSLRISVTFIIIYICHICYLLSTPRFDYAYNILFNTSIGVMHLSMWTCFSLSFQFRLPFPASKIPTPYPPLDPLTIENKPKYSYTTASLVLATTAAMSLELFDFAPFGRIIDAHSLWHAATIVIAQGWYEFMVKDAAELEAARTGNAVGSIAGTKEGRDV